MRRIRVLIVLSALVAGVLASFVSGAAPAQARINGFMTCKINLLTDGSGGGGLSTRIIECYY